MPDYINKHVIAASAIGIALVIGAVVVLTRDAEPDDSPPSLIVTTTTNTVLRPFPTTTSTEEPPTEPDKGDEEPSSITLSKYNAIAVGTSEKAFLDKAGGSCTKTTESSSGGTSDVIYQCTGWGQTGANALFQFQNVKLISKAQQGLTD